MAEICAPPCIAPTRTIYPRYCRGMRLALVALAFVAACSARKEPPAPLPRPAAIDVATPQPPSPLELRADRRVELVSIINYLAGYPEYRRAKRSAYASAVEATFRRFEDHPAVRAARELRQRNGIGYDAPMIFAVHLDDGLGLVRGEELPELDARWRGVDADAYAASVRDFARASQFDELFAAHAGAHAQAADRIRAVVGDDSPVGFFEDLFGRRGPHVVVPGLLVGPNNFGVRAGDVMYQILGDEASLGLLVHEMAHSYINPLFAGHAAALEPAGKVLYPMFEQRMRAQSYVTWQTMLNEACVRALTVLFLRERKGEAAGAAAARAELRAGFPYIDELVEVLRRFRRDRARYPRFESYLPEVIGFFDQLARRYTAAPPRPAFLGPFDAALAGDYVLALPADGPRRDQQPAPRLQRLARGARHAEGLRGGRGR